MRRYAAGQMPRDSASARRDDPAMTAAEQSATTRSLGVVTGLAKEADCLRRADAADLLMVRATAGRPADAADAARTMVDHGASGLVSFGVAGGLRHPRDFAGIWRLAKETNRALAALRAAVEAGAIDALR